jgi:hypothetical protein
VAVEPPRSRWRFSRLLCGDHRVGLAAILKDFGTNPIA